MLPLFFERPGPMQTDRVFHLANAAPAIRFPGMAILRTGFVLLLLTGARLGAQSYVPLGEAEMLQPPTAPRLVGIGRGAERSDP